MLQWTGGSRRKVYASRQSTQSKQRQYFEEKKRQQQRSGLQNQDDVEGTSGQAYGDQAPRSLDVLCINNLASPVSHPNGSRNADNAVPQVECTNISEALKKIKSPHSNNLKGASSQARLSSPAGHQYLAAPVNPREGLLGCKLSPSKIYGAKKRNQNTEFHTGEISLIDLVSDDGLKNKFTARPAREAHVSFSVKGLGHIQMETPPQSPRSAKRTFPLPPKAMRYMQNKPRQSIPFDATSGLDSILDGASMLKERGSSNVMGSLLDESVYERSKHCYFPYSFERNDNIYAEDEDIFCEPQAEKGWQSKRGRLDDNLPDLNSERLWKMESFHSDDHFPTPMGEEFVRVDYGFKERYSPERRTSTRTGTNFEASGTPSSYDLFSDHSLMDDDGNLAVFDWESHPPIKKVSNSNNTFGPSSWCFDIIDDSEKRRSPLRQRQYFEEKKRQQQRSGLQNQDDVEGTSSQAYGDQAPRSLDVQCINNLASPVSHPNGSRNADNAVPQVECTNISEALKKIKSPYNNNLKGASSQARLTSPAGHQYLAAAVNPREDLLGCKLSPSKIYGAKKRNQNTEFHTGEISLIDLVSDDGLKNKFTARPACEAHVSFSVKGLGHIQMETPPQSPRSAKRPWPYPDGNSSPITKIRQKDFPFASKSHAIHAK